MSSVDSDTSPRTSLPNRTAETDSREPGRRASIRSTIAGVQRFKQSWISILVLKGGISLGQVIALIILLSLSSALSSPLYSDLKQSQSSPACPHPEYYQAWIGVQIGRLLICWAVSLWICLRRRRLEMQEDSTDEEGRMGGRHQDAIETDSHGSRSPLSSVSTIFLTPPMPNQPSDRVPETIHISANDVNDSSPSSIQSSPKERGPVPKADTGIAAEPSSRDNVEAAQIAVSNSGSTNDISQNDDPQAQQHDMALARSMLSNHNSSNDDGPQIGGGTGFAEVMDNIAPSVSKFLGLLSFVLFILGNILLCKPLPSSPLSCYHSSPMLWWGVMVVTGVGWFLIAQMLLVILFASIGGTVVVALLSRFGVETQPDPPRNSQPTPLTLAELHRLKYVCYVPVPATPPESQATTMAVQEEHLPHPPLYLAEDRITCAICQENFIAPEYGKEALAEWLRELGCGHVYHAKCIDEWLTKGAANCPFCNYSVRNMLSDPVPQNEDRAETIVEGRRESVISRWLRKESR